MKRESIPQTSDSIEIMLQKLTAIESHLYSAKKVLNSDEAAAFLDLEKSYLFKLTSAGVLPFSKPNGKRIYFLKEDLEAWAMRSRTIGGQERAEKAATYIALNKRK